MIYSAMTICLRLNIKSNKLNNVFKKRREHLKSCCRCMREDIIDMKELKERRAVREQEIKELQFELQEVIQTDPKDKIADLKEMKARIEYLLNNWQCLDGKGLTDEQVNRSLHFVIERIIWTYPKGQDVSPKLNVVYRI